MLVGMNYLLDAIKYADHSYNIDLITRAFEFAKDCHSCQKRLSGEPYITHPINVALILINLGMDTNSVVAGLLHDVIEDTKVSKDDISEKFGADIALLVDGVTKLSNVPLYTKEEQHVENIRKMLLAMSKDIRVIVIKLADRLHNMRTAQAWSEQKRRDKSLETMEIYAPLAQRLGMRTIKEELEDIALKYLDPVAYEEITQMLQKQEHNNSIYLNNETYIEYIEQKVFNKIKNISSNAKINGRLKSHYGIYRKIYINGKDWEEVFDIYAIRVIVNTVSECYNVLGAMHEIFTPIPNRFKDYISTPKPNMYQSLHTTVIGTGGIPFEIQIRTFDMHYIAEYGIAAHWKYKQGVQKSDGLEKRLSWIRRIIELQQESDTAEDFMQSIKTDIGSEEVFVFTPNGEVKTLPIGSTIIDFAYSIHSEVGHKMIGGKINGRIAPIETKISTNQVIEIITTKSANHGPSRNWLKIVKTSEAKHKIKSWFKKEKRAENIQEGMTEIKREFARNNINLTENELQVFLDSIAHRNKFNSIDDFYAAIGYGGIVVSKIMPPIKDAYSKYKNVPTSPRQNQSARSFSTSSGVIVEGIEHCLVNLAKCCNPIPGNSIIGFITRGNGVTVHKTICPNILNTQKDITQLDKFIPVHWANSPNNKYISSLKILAQNQDNIVAKVTSELANLNITINELNAKFLKNNNVSIVFSIWISHISQLKSITQKLKKITGIISIDSQN